MLMSYGMSKNMDCLEPKRLSLSEPVRSMTTIKGGDLHEAQLLMPQYPVVSFIFEGRMYPE